MSKKQVLWSGLTILSLLLLTGCQSSNIAERRQAYASEYAPLSDEDKASVDRGALREGMTTNAVLIAWGQPTVVGTIFTPKGSFITWEYYRKRTAPERSVRREVIVPWASTPVPESRIFPGSIPSSLPPVVEWLERTAVFHDDRLVSWSPR